MTVQEVSVTGADLASSKLNVAWAPHQAGLSYRLVLAAFLLFLLMILSLDAAP